LLGTTGDVEKVLVQAIVWFQDVCTKSLILLLQSFIDFHVVQLNNTRCQSVDDAGQYTSHQTGVVMSQLHNIDVQFIVLIFTPLTNSSCLSHRALERLVLS
jgi:hypothetical protein